MDAPFCTGCRQRDTVIADLQARLAKLDAEFARQQQTIQRYQATLQRLTERLAQYEPEVRREDHPRDTPTEKPASAYSVDAENQRRRRHRRRKKSQGRRPTELKFAEAERWEDLYPKDVRHDACHLVRERAVWRLEDGRAVRVG